MYTKGQRVMATSVDSSSSTILSSGKNVRKTDLTAESVEHMWENRELMQQTKTQRQDGADMAFETVRQKKKATTKHKLRKTVQNGGRRT